MNPYQYAYNNPLRYVDPSGNIVISALQWAQVGMDLYSMVSQYADRNCTTVEQLTRNVLAGVASVVVGIAVGAVFGALGAALFPGSLLAAVIFGAVGNAFVGQFSRMVSNIIRGRDPAEGLFNIQDILIDGVIGGVGGAVGFGLERLVKSLLAARALRAAGGSVDDIITITEKELFIFGPKDGPKGGRLSDFGIEAVTDIVGPEHGPLPDGASVFADVSKSGLKGQYHSLPNGTELPDGLAVIADGSDVLQNSHHPPTHHTIYPTRKMTFEEFTELVRSLPWTHIGKIK